MKIALVWFSGTANPPELAGPDAPVPALAAALADLGHHVTLYLRRQARRRPLPTAHNRVELIQLPAGPATELSESEAIPYVGQFVVQLAHALDQQPPDVVHSHSWLAGLATTLAIRQGHYTVPVVHTFHRLESLGNPTSRGTTDGRARAERALAHQATRIIATSSTHHHMLTAAGIPPHQITVIPPAVNNHVFHPDGYTPARTHKHRLVAFGAPERTSRLIQALTAIPDTELILTGRNNSAHDPYPHADLQHPTNRIHNDSSSTAEARAALLRSADVAVSLAAPGQIGVQHLEAMACAIPVATADAAAEAVVDGITGIHLAGTGPTYLARKLRELLHNGTLRQGMGAAARDRAVNRYAWPQIAIETTRTYQQLLEPAQRPPHQRHSTSAEKAHHHSY